ncbi:methyltransferase domain protein [Dictyocaulus viviparus]|uniref:phosphoethanolamine N-methyltransferase n=1 Tax=Dictyocaulus viviparus TaxID=29172 RepID=A0A0D8X8P0_DICVI|nr:methyltransferase domain protein [Dictyocaulus viviparus]
MRTGQRMLDIGVGIGGGARQAASEFGLYVLGVDLSLNMISIALDRLNMEKDSRVTYIICNASDYDFESNSFDFVFSRDCIQHVDDAQNLLCKIYCTLKPGGKVLMTMYGVGYGLLSESFKNYIASRQYHLKNREQFREIAIKVGFTNVIVEDMTSSLKEILKEERTRAEQKREEFLARFPEADYESLVSGWNAKLLYIDDDNLNWNFFMASKPQ